jgi:glycerol uptake facilitator protein
MNVYFAELLGTAILILLGNGVVANVVLDRTKGHGAGWIVICAGWGFAVYTAVLCVGETSGAHINPAVTVGLALAGQFDWGMVPGYIVAQLVGAIVGAVVVYVFYMKHYDLTVDADSKLATFSTSPNIRHIGLNFMCEVVATFVLVYAVLVITEPSFEWAETGAAAPVPVGLGSIGAVRVGLVVFAIGLSLGGTTGYAINPARDLGPRLAHAVLPIAGKRDSDWGYAAIPVVGPLLGAALAAWLSLAA